MPDIGPMELVIILVIVLLVFGPKRLPGLGRQLGTGMREFKDSITGKDRDDADDADDAEQPARDRLPAATAATASAAPAREPEVVTAEARPEDQPAPPRRD